MKRILVVGALWVAVSGCATSYQPMGLSGGFEEIKLSEDTYRIQG